MATLLDMFIGLTSLLDNLPELSIVEFVPSEGLEPLVAPPPLPHTKTTEPSVSDKIGTEWESEKIEIEQGSEKIETEKGSVSEKRELTLKPMATVTPAVTVGEVRLFLLAKRIGEQCVADITICKAPPG